MPHPTQSSTSPTSIPTGGWSEAWNGCGQIAANWPWGELHFEPERFFDTDGERVLVFIRATATGVGSGVPVQRRTAHECTFRDGRLVRFKVYADRKKALDAAGLTD